MDPQQLKLVTGAWSGPKYDAALAGDELLHELFERSADRAPGAMAVVCGESRLTYRELDEKANRLARLLRRRGAGRETCVAFFLPRSEHIYVAMLAALKAGAAYVPLDIETPPDRIAFILQDCGARCLVPLEEPALELDHVLGDIEIVRLDADAAEIAAMPSGRPGRGETGIVVGVV
jgi:non-ribosomal peptide synthetase component F